MFNGDVRVTGDRVAGASSKFHNLEGGNNTFVGILRLSQNQREAIITTLTAVKNSEAYGEAIDLVLVALVRAAVVVSPASLTAAPYIRSADEAMTDRLDELLWVFRDQSFIPHQREEDTAQPCAVIINHTTPPKHREIMLNLSLDVSPDYADYDRLIEVVSAVSEIKHAGRERFRHYNQQGHQPKHHAVS